MPLFHYVAKVNPQKTIEDTLEAENKEAVIQHISELGYTPLKITERATQEKTSEKPALDKKIPAKHMALFTRQFASLIRSQTPVLRALRVLKEQTEHKALRAMIHKLDDHIQNEGLSLSEAMRHYPNAFASDFVNLIYAGEVGGVLQEVLDELAEKTEREELLRSKVVSALAYPAFVAVAGVGTVIVLIVFVLPKILVMLTRLKGELPLPTRMLIAATDLMTSPSFWFAAAAAAVTGALFWKRISGPVLRAIDSTVVKVPVLGKMIYELEMGRFCRSLGLLLSHGVLILQALDASIPVVGNQRLRGELKKLPDVVKQGSPLTDGLKQMSFVSPYIVHSLSVGEEGGRVSEVLLEIADFLERAATNRLQMLASLLEPLMILAVGALVGFIVMAVLLPIFEITTSVR